LIDLYWQIGETISRKTESSEKCDGVVNQLADYIAKTQPGLRGFTRPNLFRKKQFYEAYRWDEKVSPLVTQSYPDGINVFKDAYMLEFLGLPTCHSEADLHQGLVGQLKDILIELGRDFCFIGSEYPLQVCGMLRSICCFFIRDLIVWSLLN
jgi:hypothetical protein